MNYSKEELALELLKILLDKVPNENICVSSVVLAYTRILHKLEKML